MKEMSFTEVLKDTVERVDGAVSAMIICSDGIFVEGYAKEDIISPEEFGAESSAILNNISNYMKNLDLGEAKEFSVMSEKYRVIIRRINTEYHLAIVLRTEGNYGKGRFVLRTVIPGIEGEF